METDQDAAGSPIEGAGQPPVLALATSPSWLLKRRNEKKEPLSARIFRLRTRARQETPCCPAPPRKLQGPVPLLARWGVRGNILGFPHHRGILKIKVEI